MYQAFRCCIGFALALLCSHVCAESLTLPLYDVYPVKPVELRCIESKYDMQLPIPERWDVKKASLSFSYVNSASLVKRNSQLVVRLNGTPLAQIKLDPNAPEGSVVVDLPPLLLQPGYNTLSFAASQHYAEQCELPCVPELWTRVKLDEALLNLDYEERAVPLSVSSITRFLFDPKNVHDPKVHFISAHQDPAIATLGAVLASGIALRYDYRPVQFSTSETILPNRDNLLFGTTDYVNNVLADYNLSVNADTPTVQVFHLPQRDWIDEQWQVQQDSKHALLVVTGKDAEQLRVAVDSFDILSLPFPDSASMDIYEFKLPDIGLYSGKQMIQGGSQYPFNKLNFQSYTFRGFSAGMETIDFKVPPDFLIKPNQYVNVSLNFAYGAGFRIDSVLNIFLNNQAVASIHLDNPRGALVSNYQIALPTYLFKAGGNSLSFNPVLTPLITENCSFIHAENLFLTLFDSSFIEFPDMPHQINMPRLDLLFVNGFPYTRWPDGYQTYIYAPNLDSEHLAAAYNMVATMSQRNGYPLLGIELSNQLPEKFDGELMLIGTLAELPKRYLDAAPLKFGERNRVPYPLYRSFDDKPALAFSVQRSELSINRGALMQFQSLDKPGRTVVLLTGQTGQSLQRLSVALQKADVQGAINDDLALIDFIDTEDPIKGPVEKYLVSSIKAGDSYITGHGGNISPTRAFLSNNNLRYWLIMAATLALLIWLFRRMIKQQQKRRHHD